MLDFLPNIAYNSGVKLPIALAFDMHTNFPRSRGEWFVPHETTIILPNGSELRVDGIPYEGWGTAPGMYGYFANPDELDLFSASNYTEWAISPLMAFFPEAQSANLDMCQAQR